MFKIKYSIGKSDIRGFGVFSRQDILKGGVVYVHNPKLNLVLSPKEFNALQKEEKRIIEHYGYFDKELRQWRLDHDDIRFCNHSTNPNITLKKGKIIAKRKITAGEELLQDYSEFEGKNERVHF